MGDGGPDLSFPCGTVGGIFLHVMYLQNGSVECLPCMLVLCLHNNLGCGLTVRFCSCLPAVARDTWQALEPEPAGRPKYR